MKKHPASFGWTDRGDLRICIVLLGSLLISWRCAAADQDSLRAAPLPRPVATTSKIVSLQDHSFRDHRGPFLGLGASYFQALYDSKHDRARLERNLALLSAKRFNYVRILSMVSWEGLEIAPVTFTNRTGRVVPQWPDYWRQFRDLIQLAGREGLRVEVTIFADAQRIMPEKSTRLAHLEAVLSNLTGFGLEDRVLHLEVANEAWQNGFPEAQGVSDLREFTKYLAERTALPVAITWNGDTSDRGLLALYAGSGADLGTIHFSRDTRTKEQGWLPVRDCYRAGRLSGLPPVTSNEPIGPGSSVGSEDDPVKLCCAAVFAYLANLPGYVFHSRTGIYGYERCCPPGGEELSFERTPGIDAFQHLPQLLPSDLASWTRNDGLEPAAPFTVLCDGLPNTYWPGRQNARTGCLSNIGSAREHNFYCLPIGILPGGVQLQARRAARVAVINPLIGITVTNVSLRAQESFVLAQGPGAYLLKGTWVATSPEQR